MNGAASVTRVQFADFRGEAFFYTWPSLDFGVSGYEPRKVGWFVAGFQGFVPYKTDKGIGLQSTRSDVLKAYGKPTIETMPRQGQTNLIYDALGIDFQMYHDGTIREMRIFRPGSAKSIWKF
ncbi:MAG TPA: hypothetical protein VJT33_03475 [bacterium]|nr:hypothetical protein [bacterium]